MLSEYKVEHLMISTNSYPIVSSEATLKEAISILKEAFHENGNKVPFGHRTLLVKDNNNKLIGILTMRALLQAFEPGFLKVDKWPLTIPVFWEGLFTERCREKASKKVKEIMIPLQLVAVNTDDSISKAVHAMLQNKLGSLPVLKNNQVAGILRANEIFLEANRIMSEA